VTRCRLATDSGLGLTRRRHSFPRRLRISNSGYQSEQLRASRVNRQDQPDLAEPDPANEFLKAAPPSSRRPAEAEIRVNHIDMALVHSLQGKVECRSHPWS
jgi:hypothetical protein